MIENNKIVNIFTEGLMALIEIFFNGVNLICTSGAKFISSYTDILSVSQLEMLLFVTIFILIVKAVVTGLSDLSRLLDKFIHSHARTKSKKDIRIQGIRSKLQFQTNTNALQKNKKNKDII